MAGLDPVGQQIRIGGPAFQRLVTVVGLVKDTQGQNETDVPAPEFYLSYLQSPAAGMTLVVRAVPYGWNASAETPPRSCGRGSLRGCLGRPDPWKK